MCFNKKQRTKKTQKPKNKNNILPCHCNAVAMMLPCCCQVVAMLLLCLSRVTQSFVHRHHHVMAAQRSMYGCVIARLLAYYRRAFVLHVVVEVAQTRALQSGSSPPRACRSGSHVGCRSLSCPQRRLHVAHRRQQAPLSPGHLDARPADQCPAPRRSRRVPPSPFVRAPNIKRWIR